VVFIGPHVVSLGGPNNSVEVRLLPDAFFNFRKNSRCEMAVYSEIVKGIRARFVGTAEEHELLLALQKDFNEAELNAQKRIEEEYRERNEALSVREMRVMAISGECRIDDAVFNWLGQQGRDFDDGGWAFEHVVGAMRGRGLSAEHLEKIAGAMKGEKVSA
jgi:hypothetical protein